MSSIRNRAALAAVLCGVLAACGASDAALIAYWDQNSNEPSPGVFGFVPSDFPQAADQGAGQLSIADFDATLKVDGTYDFIESFSGNALNAQPGVLSGGSLSPENSTNNGMSILLSVSTVGFEDITVSWAQRGTGTGYNSRAFSYSTDGVTFTPFDTDLGALTSTWVLESYDLSSIASVENASSVTFKITLDGATSSSGNNRFDNITIEGTPLIPEPASLALLGLCFAGLVGVRYRLG